MKPILNQLYVWDGNKFFDNLKVKDHPSGYRYAKNAEIDGVTKTFILITRSNHPEKQVEDYFNRSAKAIKADKDALKVFKQPAYSPVLANVPSI